MKDIGLLGLPYAGKSTGYTALTRTAAAPGHTNQGVAGVPDARLHTLARLEGSPSVVPAQLRLLDVPGSLTAQGLAHLRETDALALVLRGFGPDADPAHDLAEVRAELLLADLSVLDGALDGARRRAKGRGSGGAEVDLLERAHDFLSNDRPLSELSLSEDERKVLRGLAPLSLKPWIVVTNLEEGTALPPGLPAETVPVWAELEAETAEMPDEDARALLAEFGVQEPGIERIATACYRALDLITFFTFNEKEARAWQLRRRGTAHEAAGIIHSDMERGFIRAEVVPFEDLAAVGGWHEARAKGRLRVEGRDHVVQEGDVLHIRFAV